MGLHHSLQHPLHQHQWHPRDTDQRNHSSDATRMLPTPPIPPTPPTPTLTTAPPNRLYAMQTSRRVVARQGVRQAWLDTWELASGNTKNIDTVPLQSNVRSSLMLLMTCAG